ncbi:MAG: hypothetical protein K6F50_02085 [Kiritimatiellae bacterium]|nr:hypothetical protein [Kiritimatiellia bacterium]
MVKRFRMIAGPNGSGKSTLVRWLQDDYKVNFYSFVNADDIFALVAKTGAYSPKFPVSKEELVSYAESTTYGNDVKDAFRGGQVQVDGDCVRFDKAVVNSYTMALFANFLQDRFISRGESFSQETVFSHPSKLNALKQAKDCGYRTYLYFVATGNPSVNLCRVASRYAQGGHDVPEEKILSRFNRSLNQLKSALPFLFRAFVFDNTGDEMDYLGQYEEGRGWLFSREPSSLPRWFVTALA